MGAPAANPAAQSFDGGSLALQLMKLRTFIALFATRWDLSQAARVFLTVGICGGYTTFKAE